MNMQKFSLLLGLSLITGCGGGGSGTSTPPPSPPPPPPAATQTLSYSAADFERIAVNGSFEIEITQGSDYLVEVTIDSAEAAKLNVVSDGTTLDIGFLPGSDVRADTLQAVVRAPVLERLELDGSNNATVSGFDTSFFEIDINGSNVVTSFNTSYEYVFATVAGNSLIDFANVTAAPAAHFDVSGDSTATINLQDFATVTGSVMNTASFMYYGTDVSLQMDVAPTASVQRLGGSR